MRVYSNFVGWLCLPGQSFVRTVIEAEDEGTRMAYEQILYGVADGVGTVTLNRPEKLNAWTSQMGREVEQALAEAAEDDAVRVVVITGAGRAFCSGADLSLLAQLSGEGKDVAASLGSELFATPFNVYLPRFPKPLLAAINGPCVGMGLIFALYSDIRYASSSARLSTVFAKLGLIAEWGAAWILPRLVGLSRSFEILYGAQIYDADEALRMGLVSAVFPEESFAEEVQKRALHMASAVSPRAVQVMRAQVYAGLEQTNDEAHAHADREMRASLVSADFREGVTAYLGKRPPVFPGR